MALAAINVENPACGARSKTTIERKPQWSKLFFFIVTKFNLHLSFWVVFCPFIGRVARYTPSSRLKNDSKIKANLDFHLSSDDFIANASPRAICPFLPFRPNKGCSWWEWTN